ncbi:hypothetical protein LY76DRAFT_79446 [Colletotrichum caudatum]|nr:hypothetical protein LY76DRAFT_79446 [Colletotrichum caudatum]
MVASSGDAPGVMVGISFHTGGIGSTARRKTLGQGVRFCGNECFNPEAVVRVRSSSRPYSFISLFPAVDRRVISKWAKTQLDESAHVPGTPLVLAAAAPTVVVARANKHGRQSAPKPPDGATKERQRRQKGVHCLLPPPFPLLQQVPGKPQETRHMASTGSPLRSWSPESCCEGRPNPQPSQRRYLHGWEASAPWACAPFRPLSGRSPARPWHTICGRVPRDRCRGGGGAEACAVPFDTSRVGVRRGGKEGGTQVSAAVEYMREIGMSCRDSTQVDSPTAVPAASGKAFPPCLAPVSRTMQPNKSERRCTSWLASTMTPPSVLYDRSSMLRVWRTRAICHDGLPPPPPVQHVGGKEGAVLSPDNTEDLAIKRIAHFVIFSC